MKPPKLLLGAPAALALISSARADAPISFSVPRDGRTSLAIYDQEGRLVRTRLTGQPRAAGQYSASWDGLDRYGNAMPAGDYTWKLLATGGLRAEFITQVGQNADPIWEKATGNHQAPNAVAVDATGLYRAGAVNEGAHWGVKTDLDGRHLWTNDRWAKDPWVQETAAVTLVGERLFELLPNGDVYGYEAKTGRVFTGGDKDPKPWMLRWDGFEPPTDIADEERRKLIAAQSPRDLAGDAANELLVAAYPQHDALAWFSAENGRLVDTATGIANLTGVTVAHDGTVFAISQGAVVALTRERKTPREVIVAAKLHGPWRLCVSPTTGEIFVAENSDRTSRGASGSPHHQVKRFSAGGALLQTYGRPGGRSDGPYVPTDASTSTAVACSRAVFPSAFMTPRPGASAPATPAASATSGRIFGTT